MTIKERLERCVRLLTDIEARREQCGDPSIFSSVERRIVDRELRELSEEWARNPQSPRVADIRSLR